MEILKTCPILQVALKVYSILRANSKNLEVSHLIVKVHNYYNIKLFKSNAINLHKEVLK